MCYYLLHKYHGNRAFTLVELSIVIIIIALIIAGVSAGTTLIKQSRLQSIINDINKYKSAYNSFLVQYNALPGDINNAYSYWGNRCDSTANNCNGNGDRQIAQSTWNTGGATNHESFRAWQHLTLSGLINGNYTGTGNTDGSSYLLIPGVNSPVLSIKNGTCFFRYDPDVAAESGTAYIAANVLIIGAKNGTNGMANTNLLTPKEAFIIDSKIDDGKPDTGKIYGAYGATGVSNCTAGTNPNGYYNTTNSAISCILEVIP